MLTDRRWQNGSAQLVRRIADSRILDAEQLDLLTRTFLAADYAIYWRVPDEWFAGGEQFVIEFDDEGPDDATDDDPGGVAEEEPTVARREVVPPLRRWAAADAVDGWAHLDPDVFEDRVRFVRQFVAAVASVVEVPEAAFLSNNLSNEPRGTDPDDAGHTSAGKAVDLHEHGRNRTRPDRRPPDSGAHNPKVAGFKSCPRHQGREERSSR